MGIDSSDDIESSSLSGSSEGISEKSEKQREASKKAQSQLQKTKKDEQKARGDNDALFLILTHFIKNPYYEDLVLVVTRLLQEGFPSRYIILLVALVYPDAALYVFGTFGDREKAMKITTLHRYDKETDFHEQDIHPSLRDWISLWIGTGEKYIVQKDGSIILLQKFLDLLTDSSTSSTAIFAAERFFRFFFFSRNVILQEKQSLQYARFITQTLEHVVRKNLEHVDEDLKKHDPIQENDLFGL